MAAAGPDPRLRGDHAGKEMIRAREITCWQTPDLKCNLERERGDTSLCTGKSARHPRIECLKRAGPPRWMSWHSTGQAVSGIWTRNCTHRHREYKRTSFFDHIRDRAANRQLWRRCRLPILRPLLPRLSCLVVGRSSLLQSVGHRDTPSTQRIPPVAPRRSRRLLAMAARTPRTPVSSRGVHRRIGIYFTMAIPAADCQTP
jgi:hypothetical protein